MKKLLIKALVLVFGLGVTTTFTACHTGENSSDVVTNVTPKHSISGTILKSDGTALTGATVKINNSAVTVSGNTFSRDGLADGTYTIEIACAGYKTITESVDLALETVKGSTMAKAISKTYYLADDAVSNPLTFGSTSAQDAIVIETTAHKDADGTNANDTEGQIEVEAATPTITGDANDPTTDLGDINQQIQDQSGNTEDITNYSVTLTNITCLEDAKAVAVANKVASSRMTRATTAMDADHELLAGVAVNAGPYTITLPGTMTFTITIKMPDDVKGAITLFRTFTGDKWNKIDMKNLNTTEAAGIKSIDTNTAGVIKIELTTIQTQSFGFGVVVGETTTETRWDEVVVDPITTGATARKVSSMPYKMNTGVVLTQSSKSSLTDFLRKIVIRKYGTRIVKTPKVVDKQYVFSPAYQMHANGTLYLTGWQEITETTFSVANTAASFTATEYGDAFFTPYEVWEEVEVVHGGGSN